MTSNASLRREIVATLCEVLPGVTGQWAEGVAEKIISKLNAPAWVIDASGDRWEVGADGMYRFEDYGPSTIDEIVRTYGIQSQEGAALS